MKGQLLWAFFLSPWFSSLSASDRLMWVRAVFVCKQEVDDRELLPQKQMSSAFKDCQIVAHSAPYHYP